MSGKSSFVVGIGASAGGLDAIQQLFDNIPSNTGMSFIIVQHLSPDFKSLMPELLSKHTRMQIFTSEDKQSIKPNCIYLNPKNKNLLIKGDKLYLTEKSPRHKLSLPIDIFFHTLGDEYKDKSVGIILSGTGSDGSRGIKTIKEAGGTSFVQKPESAQFDGMPNASIATNLVDFILPPEQIAETLLRLPNHQILLSEEEEGSKSNEIIYFEILELVHKKTNIDFRQYKKNTLLRRLEKRIALNNLNNLSDYQVYLKSNPNEVQLLKRDFLIGVTSFFRDVEAFDLMKMKVIPELCKRNREDKDPIRIWVPGCSTGEEVLSLALLIDNHIKQERLNIDYRIFATDIDENALEIAGAGIYSLSLLEEIPGELADLYLLRDADKIQVIKRIREHIVFSVHNLLKDPPFIRMDLISCRNLLIYLEASAQKKVLMNFQFALKKNGMLFLGSSESLGTLSKNFKPISAKWKIFSSIVDSRRVPPQEFPEERTSSFVYRNTELQTKPSIKFQYKENPENVFYKYMSRYFGYATIFIDNEFNVLFINGDVSSRLSINEGVFESNILTMVDKDIATIIRNSIRKVEKDGIDIFVNDVISHVGTEKYCFDLGFHKVNDPGIFQDLFLIFFSNDRPFTGEKASIIKNVDYDEMSIQRLDDLEDELKINKARLQSVIEQLETSNEELQSSNEELMASNEELQSTNEELQSVNEELYTVNAELQEKDRELSFLNNDINNLLNSTDIGTLFLDVDMRIRKFTPALTKHFNLQEEDIGRNIASFAANFDKEDQRSILEDCKIVLADMSTIEKEVCDDKQHCYLRRISPFISAERKIEGLVIAFIDITEKVKASEEIIKSERYLNMAQSIAKLGYWELNLQTNELLWSDSIFHMLGVNKKDFSNTVDGFYNLVHPNDRQEVSNAFENALKTKTDYKIKHRFIRPDGRTIYVEERAEFSSRDITNSEKIFGTVLDITDITLSQTELIASERRFKSIFENAAIGIATIGKNGIPIMVNNELIEILGYSEQELMTMSFTEFTHPDDVETELELYKQLIKGERDSYYLNKRFIKKDGSIGWGELTASVFRNKFHEVEYTVAIIKDISEKHHQDILIEKTNIALERSEIRFRSLFENLSHAFALHKIIYNEKGEPWDYEFIIVNKKFEEETGLSARKCIGNTVKQLLPKTEDSWIKLYGKVAKNGNALDFENFSQEMNKYYHVVAYSPEKDYFATVFYDISDKKKYENSLQQSKRIAEDANHFKNQLLGNISHEIRTPMNGILGFTALLKDNDLSADSHQKYVDIVYNNTKQVLSIIDDIIDVSKIEEGQLTITEEECNLYDLMEQVYENFKHLKIVMKKEHIKLSLSLPESLKSKHFLLDSTRVQQILFNLIGNALKYTFEGEVQFGCSLKNNKLNFFVKDTGIGIPAEQQNNIFNRYQRVENNLDEAVTGRGLGLTITSGIVNLMEGQISLESVPGEGSQFFVSLPVKLPVKPQLTQSGSTSNSHHRLKGKTILLAEDDGTTRILFSEYLKHEEINLLIADNGRKAVDLYKKNSVDLVLMDLKMPEMNGFRAIKEIIDFNPEAIIIAETSFALQEEKQRCLASGCKEYLIKPIIKERLLSALYKYL